MGDNQNEEKLRCEICIYGYDYLSKNKDCVLCYLKGEYTQKTYFCTRFIKKKKLNE